MAQYDKQRLRDDDEYRQKVLDDMAVEAKSRWFYTKLKTSFYILLTIFVFAAGIFLGGRLTSRQADWVTLGFICIFIVPMMGWMLVSVHNHRKKTG